MNTSNSMWTVQELACFLNTSRGAVYKLVKRRQVPHIRIGKRVLFDPEGIRAWIDRRRIHAEQDIFRDD